MPTDRELDQLIDAALPSYSSVEPRSGLEHRILSRTLAEQRPKRSLIWGWTLATPAAACLLIILFFARRHNSHRNTLEATATTAPVVAVATPRETTAAGSFPVPRKRPTSPKASNRPSTARETLPKQDIFPSPSPLTAEERAAIALVRAPAPIPQQADTAARVDINPIHIAELQIKPIGHPDDLPSLLATESSLKALQP